jgi:antitoxin (DNA-binding transcriptional repressor) of toxin-antitoxin stability system
MLSSNSLCAGYVPQYEGSGTLALGSYRRYFARMNVGTKELKNRLSHYLRLVREGERVSVCDRGKVIAELRPAEGPSEGENEALKELARKGLVTLGRGRLRDVAPIRPQRRGRRLSTIVLEDRG